jgi:hypothetical protein
MTTTKIRAGTVYGCAFKDCTRPDGPCAGNCLLHRVDASTLPAQAVAIVTPQGCTGDCRQGRDCTCRSEAKRLPNVPQPKRDSDHARDVRASNFAFWIWSALMWTAIWFCLGFIYARHLS